MKASTLLVFCLLCLATPLSAQSGMTAYKDNVKRALDLYQVRKYREAGEAFTAAFLSMGGKGLENDRYNAACVWALAGEKDSAFSQLSRIILAVHYSGYLQMNVDPDLEALHDDARWEALLDMARSNRQAKEPVRNQELLYKLDSVYILDQRGRRMLEQGELASSGVITLKRNVAVSDSLNVITVRGILDHGGWPAKEAVGSDGLRTLFLVIQHADYYTQKRYFSMIEEAAKRKELPAQFPALLLDRILMEEGKPQVYGSQVIQHRRTRKYMVYNLSDPRNVDKRRLAVGMLPMAEYLKPWGIAWDTGGAAVAGE